MSRPWQKQRPSVTPDVPMPPAIEGRADAIDAADRENILNQSVIGAKEGVTDAINAKVGTRVTNSVLRTADGTDYKSIDESKAELFLQNEIRCF